MKRPAYKNSQGFSAVEIIIVIAIIGLVTAAGIFIYRSQHRTPAVQPLQTKQQAQLSEVSTAEPTVPSAETANWKQVTNSNLHYSFKYPDDGSYLPFLSPASAEESSRGRLINSAGVNYTGCGRNCGLAFSFNVYSKGSDADPGSNWAADQITDNTFYRLASKKTVNINGISGTRAEYVPEDDTVAHIVYYYFATSNESYTFTINLNGAKSDNLNITARGDEIMSTFEFTDQ